MIRFGGIFVLVLSVIMLSGCKQSMRNYWKDSRAFYRSYINTPATLDNSKDLNTPSVEIKLAALVSPIDKQLRRLQRVLDGLHRFPSDEWLLQLPKRFPWLSGIALVDNDGMVLMQLPDQSLEDHDLAPLLQQGEEAGDAFSRELRAHVATTDIGPKVYLATPIFSGYESKGVMVVHFDLRNLLRYASSPADLVILSSAGLLWSGMYDYPQTPLANEDWNAHFSNRVTGESEDDNGRFIWLVRYLGDIPLLFAVSEDDYPRVKI